MQPAFAAKGQAAAAAALAASPALGAAVRVAGKTSPSSIRVVGV